MKNIVTQLHLNKCMSTTIGRLSGGEKKRLAFASVLLTEPHVILIDEPTSGLDAYLAKSLMSMIRLMAVEQNHAVIVVLHQPTNSMFDLLDTLCLLVQNGRQAFFGTKEEAEKFFISKCRLSAKSLDGFIEQLAAPSESDNRDDIAQEIAADQYAKSEEAHLLRTIIEGNLEGNGKTAEIPIDDVRGTSFGRQLKWLLWRSIADSKRNPARTTRLFLRMIIMGFIIGFVFFRLSPNASDYVQNVRALVFAILLGLYDLNMSLVVLGILSERAVVIREYKQRIYSLRAYYLNRLVIDLCYIVVICVLYTSIIVLLTDLHRGLLVISITTLSVMTACAIAALVATLSSTPQVALLILNPLQQILCTVSGIYISIRSIPLYVRWFKYLSYWFYGFNLLLILQWHHIDTHLPCDRTCLSEYVTNSTRNNTNVCTRVGDDVLLYQYSIVYQEFGRDVAMLIILIVAFHLTTFMFLVFKVRRAM
jgi:energy-coupling factor transporter ATP-binding protein EcfA2